MSLKTKALSVAIAANLQPHHDLVEIEAEAPAAPSTVEELLEAAFVEYQAQRAAGGDKAAFLEVAGNLLAYQAQVYAALQEATPLVFTEEHLVAAAQRVCELAGKKWWQIGMPQREHLIETQRQAFAAAAEVQAPALQRCRACGCTWTNACEGGCHWVEPDLCSACADPATTEGKRE